ncbi:MAG: hypothetical protein JO270_22270 [Acidobacteriaceae bacterium]|nr:hypothetical protein [Acidobacteriaceae bacterium]MBV8570166.1 hypothetical protein [Acidobacteriaceae bacterium]
MISFFPDLNVWIALSVAGHCHSKDAWRWMALLPRDFRFIFSRYTQIGMLRLLTNEAVMGKETLTMRGAWRVYDQWLEDPRVEFYPEPRGIEAALRTITEPFAGKHAYKWVGDCYLLAYAKHSQATLVTFDRTLVAFAEKQGHSAITPS